MIKATDLLQLATKRGMRMVVLCLSLTILGAWSSRTASASTLRQASYEAMTACLLVEAISVEHCGNVISRGPLYTAARLRVRDFHIERSRFARVCSKDAHACELLALQQIELGFNDALDPPVAQTRSLPRSDMRR